MTCRAEGLNCDCLQRSLNHALRGSSSRLDHRGGGMTVLAPPDQRSANRAQMRDAHVDDHSSRKPRNRCPVEFRTPDEPGLDDSGSTSASGLEWPVTKATAEEISR